METIRRDKPATIATDDGIVVAIDWNRTYTWPNPYQANTENVGRGICATVLGVPQGPPMPFLEVEYGVHAVWAWQGDKPVTVVGITDPEAALEDLVDTGRAYRAYERNRSARTTRTFEVLQAAAATLTAAEQLPPDSHERYKAVQDAIANRDRMITLAVQDGLVEWHWIAQTAGVDVHQVERLAAYVQPTPPTYYLGLEGFANRLGVTVATIKSYRSRGMLPDPDTTIGGSPGWLLATADAYQDRRRGQGFRTDLEHDPLD